MPIRIYVNVTSQHGYDTKYAFMGSTPYLASYGTINGSGATRAINTLRNGEEDKSLEYRATGTDWTWLSGSSDFGGQITTWTVQDRSDSSHAILLKVSAQTDGVTPTALAIDSFGMLTLDGYLSAQTTATQTFSVFITGEIGDDTLRGSFQSDSMKGGGGRDSLLGGDGNDSLDGGSGADTLRGASGDDRYYVDNKSDKVVEAKGDGHDTVITTIDYTLGDNVESLIGSGSRDLNLTGNSAANGLEGSSGADTIKGQDGADAIAGHAGKDVLYGGKGKDSFLFVTNPVLDKPDTIKDFKHSDDTIKISQDAFVGLFPIHIAGSNFTLPAERFHSSKSGKAHDGDDRIIYDTDDGKLYFDPDGNGAQDRVLFANLTGHPNVMADDIWVI